MIKQLKKKIKLFFQNSERSPELKKLYIADLNLQISHFLGIAGLLALVAWLGFIPIDKKLHPEISLLYFRLGLSLCGAILLILLFILKKATKEKYGIILFSIPLAYLFIITPVSTGLVQGDSPYVSGMNIVIMLLPIIPLPLWLALSYLFVSALLLFVLMLDVDLTDYSTIYNLDNIIVTYVTSATLCYVMDIIRFQFFYKSIQLKTNLHESESLLLNILPKEVAVELKMYGSATPIRYRSVSVLFTDFVGFTSFSKDLEPEDLVRQLDQCFSFFDTITEEYRLEKLKTIGDAYMCAGGVPTPNTTHAVDTVLAALEMQDFAIKMKEIKKKQEKPFWDIRIGINTGSLVAGVVGKIKFAYDVWGETVNTASRMESYGVSNEINISQSTYEIVKDFFECEARGKIDVKNNGLMEMYLVKGIKKELAEKNEDGITKPNPVFQQKYSELKNSIVEV